MLIQYMSSSPLLQDYGYYSNEILTQRYFNVRPTYCKSMHSYDAIIDLPDRDTIKQDKPLMDRGAGRRVTMDYSFVIQTVILVVTQAIPAESARGQ